MDCEADRRLFVKGTAVIGKSNNFPEWPCLICDPPNHLPPEWVVQRGNYTVMFFGSRNFGKLPHKGVKRYNIEVDKYETKPKQCKTLKAAYDDVEREVKDNDNSPFLEMYDYVTPCDDYEARLQLGKDGIYWDFYEELQEMCLQFHYECVADPLFPRRFITEGENLYDYLVTILPKNKAPKVPLEPMAEPIEQIQRKKKKKPIIVRRKQPEQVAESSEDKVDNEQNDEPSEYAQVSTEMDQQSESRTDVEDVVVIPEAMLEYDLKTCSVLLEKLDDNYIQKLTNPELKYDLKRCSVLLEKLDDGYIQKVSNPETTTKKRRTFKLKRAANDIERREKKNSAQKRRKTIETEKISKKMKLMKPRKPEDDNEFKLEKENVIQNKNAAKEPPKVDIPKTTEDSYDEPDATFSSKTMVNYEFFLDEEDAVMKDGSVQIVSDQFDQNGYGVDVKCTMMDPETVLKDLWANIKHIKFSVHDIVDKILTIKMLWLLRGCSLTIGEYSNLNMYIKNVDKMKSAMWDLIEMHEVIKNPKVLLHYHKITLYILVLIKAICICTFYSLEATFFNCNFLRKFSLYSKISYEQEGDIVRTYHNLFNFFTLSICVSIKEQHMIFSTLLRVTNQNKYANPILISSIA